MSASRYGVFLFLLAALPATAQTLAPATPALYGGGDGSSCDAAVIVNLADRKQGVAAEYQWLQEKFSGGKRGRQAFARGRDGKTYDTIEWIKPDGSSAWVCFDISQFAGNR
jgi:hypothetical protein